MRSRRELESPRCIRSLLVSATCICTEGFCWSLDKEHWQGLTGAGGGGEEHGSAGWGRDEKEERAQKGDGRQGKPASYSCIGQLCPHPPDTDSVVLTDHGDISSAQASEGEGLRHQRQSGERSGRFYSSQVICQWVSFLSFSHIS